MPWHLLLLVAPLFLTAPAALWLITHLYHRNGFYDAPLMLLIGAASLWATVYGIELLLPGFNAKMWAVCFEYPGIVTVPVAWLLVGLQLNGQVGRLKPWMLVTLFVIPCISLIQVFAWQSSWPYFWVTRGIAYYHSWPVLANTFGPGLWTQIGYSYLLQLLGGVLILNSVFRSGQPYLVQRVLLIFALLLPWFANAAYIFKLFETPIDFTPLGIVVSAIALFVSMLRYGLGDLVPVAREKIFSEMREGVLLFDNRRRLIDANGAALRMLGTDAKAIGKSADALFAGHSALLSLLRHRHRGDDLLYGGFDRRVFRVTAEDIGPGGDQPFKLLVFNDLSIGSRIESTLRLVVESTSGDLGEGFFRSLTRALAFALGAKYAFVGAVDKESRRSVRTLAFWNNGQFADNFTYELAGSPCERLLTQRTYIIAGTLEEEFSNAFALAQLDATDSIGTRLSGVDRSMLGVLVVMNDAPFSNVQASASVLEVFATRAAAELERQAADARLQESEERYRRIVETTRDGICVLDAAARIEFVNAPMAAMIDRDASALIGAPLRDQFYRLGPQSDPFSFEDATVEAQLMRGDGRKLHVTISKTVIPAAGVNLGGALMIFTDITESRRLEEQNAHIELQLQHAQKLESLGVLAGGIAHDFNNLLMPILGYLDVIRERIKDDSLATDYLQRIGDAGSRLADLCNQMLTYSGKGKSTKRPLDLNEIMERMTDLISASTAKGIQIDYELSREISAIRGDETQLDQIIVNLILNASEAMSDKRSGHIVMSTGEESLDAERLKTLSNGESVTPGRYVYVEVADQGSGIAERDVTRLFEPFFTTKFTGRGLGMAVVFGIVKGHRGAISVSSTPGVGTRIRIYFPTFEETFAESAPIANPADRGLVLVVDDEELVRNTVRNMLESAGYQVITANDGGTGYRTFMHHADSISACVIDVTMPGLDGYGLVEKIRGQHQFTPVVLVSGYHQDRFDDRDIDRVGNLVFLQKPFDSAGLADAVASASRGRQTDQSPV